MESNINEKPSYSDENVYKIFEWDYSDFVAFSTELLQTYTQSPNLFFSTITMLCEYRTDRNIYNIFHATLNINTHVKCGELAHELKPLSLIHPFFSERHFVEHQPNRMSRVSVRLRFIALHACYSFSPLAMRTTDLLPVYQRTVGERPLFALSKGILNLDYCNSNLIGCLLKCRR